MDSRGSRKSDARAIGVGSADRPSGGRLTRIVLVPGGKTKDTRKIARVLAEALGPALEITATTASGDEATQHALERADRRVVVAETGADATPNATERLLYTSGLCVDHLVLEGEVGPKSRWTNRTETSRPRFTHALSLDQKNDVLRLARFVSGQAVGVVLGGGGARTLAHIGALRALRDAGVPIDLIGGCSGGAIFAALHALGWEIDAMERIAFRHFVELGDPMVATLPLLSLFSERRFLRMLSEMFGERSIEEMALPFYCVSANITRRELAVHRTGLVRTAVRASMSVPGIAPPHVERGELFVDGCVLDSLPVRTMRDLGAGVVIGIDVSVARGPSVSRDLERMPSVFELLRRKMRFWQPRTKVAYWWDVMLASALASGARDTTSADLVIAPALQGYAAMDFRHMRAMIAIAERDVANALADFSWRAEAAQ